MARYLIPTSRELVRINPDKLVCVVASGNYSSFYHVDDCIRIAGVSNEEISCTGCEVGNVCRYKIVGCAQEKGAENCGKCEKYPCAQIERCFEATEGFAPACRAACTDEEYELLHKAFFEKKKNLDTEKNAVFAKKD